MEIKKVLNLSKEEFEVLIKAGEIIGMTNKALENKEADSLAEETLNLIKALADVTSKVTSK